MAKTDGRRAVESGMEEYLIQENGGWQSGKTAKDRRMFLGAIQNSERQ